MIILAIDPGTTESAYTLYEKGNIIATEKIENHLMFPVLQNSKYDVLAIETVASYGMAVGQTTFTTCIWAGRFIQAAVFSKKPFVTIFRKQVKLFLCGSLRAKDSNVRQVIIDRYPPTGGGKKPQIGTKKQPGPLFGVANDMWQSLAVAITYDEETP